MANTCETCYQVACKNCPWVATDEEVFLIQKEVLTACPKCGWKPNNQTIVA